MIVFALVVTWCLSSIFIFFQFLLLPFVEVDLSPNECSERHKSQRISLFSACLNYEEHLTKHRPTRQEEGKASAEIVQSSLLQMQESKEETIWSYQKC